jgi:hypothetical protein
VSDVGTARPARCARRTHRLVDERRVHVDALVLLRARVVKGAVGAAHGPVESRNDVQRGGGRGRAHPLADGLVDALDGAAHFAHGHGRAGVDARTRGLVRAAAGPDDAVAINVVNVHIAHLIVRERDVREALGRRVHRVIAVRIERGER